MKTTIKSSRTSKMEIVIPTWAGRIGPGYWGDRDYSGYDDQSTSFWVLLRGVMPGERQSFLTDDGRAVADIGLFVYATVMGTISMDLRLHDVSSMTLREGEMRIKVLKRLLVKGKVYPFSDFTRDTSVFTELTKAMAALGIHRTMVYHGINESETFEPVGIAIRRIADCVDERLERLKRRQVA